MLIKLGDRVRLNDTMWNGCEGTIIEIFPPSAVNPEYLYNVDDGKGSGWVIPARAFELIGDETSIYLEQHSMYGLSSGTLAPRKGWTHAGHEVVDNTVLAKTFRYCRTCKVEV